MHETACHGWFAQQFTGMICLCVGVGRGAYIKAADLGKGKLKTKKINKEAAIV